MGIDIEPGSGAFPAAPAGTYLGPLSATRGTLALGTTTQPRMGGWLPIFGPQPVDQVRFDVTVGGDASAVIQAALYRQRAAASSVFDKMVESPTTPVTSAGIASIGLTVTTLTAGRYLYILEASGFTSTVPTVRMATTHVAGPYTSQAAELSDPRGGVHWIHLDPAAGLPASFTLPTLTDRQYAPLVYFRAA